MIEQSDLYGNIKPAKPVAPGKFEQARYQRCICGILTMAVGGYHPRCAEQMKTDYKAMDEMYGEDEW